MSMNESLWQQCIPLIKNDLPDMAFTAWILPLQADVQTGKDGDVLRLFAPNQFVLDNVKATCLDVLKQAIAAMCETTPPVIQLIVGSRPKPNDKEDEKGGADASGRPVHQAVTNTHSNTHSNTLQDQQAAAAYLHTHNRPFKKYVFDNLVEGKSNQLARAAALQVAENPGSAYNPLFIYGGVGLGKTHLMHAVGNVILQRKPNCRVLYLHSERFVADMVKALQQNSIDQFKRFYRSAEALLIDDIQFFAGKERTQEEFFHTFNALVDNGQQVVLTCDRYPKEINGLEERLKSRFNWGLTVAVEPPELEMRVAILMAKAEQSGVTLPHEVAFFIAKRVQSNVRELEGALKRVVANAHFTGRAITLDFTRDALKDLIAVQAKLVSIDNIQKTVADYYKLKVADLLSKRRMRFMTRARQVAMALAKELTTHSLPEIGEAFNGRDHTTVLHACRKIKSLLEEDAVMKEDYINLLRTLST